MPTRLSALHAATRPGSPSTCARECIPEAKGERRGGDCGATGRSGGITIASRPRRTHEAGQWLPFASRVSPYRRSLPSRPGPFESFGLGKELIFTKPACGKAPRKTELEIKPSGGAAVLSSSPARFAGCRSSGLVPLPLAANRPLPVAADRVDSTHASGCRSTGVLMVLLCKVP